MILNEKATPVLSSRMSDRTSDDGVMVGNGPAVSVGVTVQELLPVLLPVPVSDVVVAVAAASFLHAAMITGTDVAPIRKFLKNFFLDSMH